MSKQARSEKMNWTLLAIAAGNGEALTPVQLQKSLFLFQKTFPRAAGNQFYNFQPYNYGPFDRNVYIDAETLAEESLVFIDRSGNFATYAATPKGIAEAEKLNVETRAAKHLQSLVRWALPLSFNQIVRAVYKQYPEMQENSIFAD